VGTGPEQTAPSICPRPVISEGKRKAFILWDRRGGQQGVGDSPMCFAFCSPPARVSIDGVISYTGLCRTAGRDNGPARFLMGLTVRHPRFIDGERFGITRTLDLRETKLYERPRCCHKGRPCIFYPTGFINRYSECLRDLRALEEKG